jgi:hypothetical protein
MTTTPSKRRLSRGALVFDKPSRTKQSFKDQCDVNKLMARYVRTGTIAQVMSATPRYEDFSNVDDYKTAMDMLRETERNFNQLSPEIRDEFDNNPQELLELVEAVDRGSEEAIAFARELGLVGELPDQAEAPPSIPDPTPDLPPHEAERNVGVPPTD